MKDEDVFNRCVALVFDRALNAFPTPLRVFDFGQLEPAIDREPNELYDSTLDFLIREGLVDGRRIRATAPVFANVVLTLRGLTLLKSVPDSVSDKRTWGERVKAVATLGGTETLSAVIPRLLDYAARLGP